MKIENEYYTDSKVDVKAVIVTIETMEEAFKLINDPQIVTFIANSNDEDMFYVASEVIDGKIIIRVEEFGTAFLPEDIALVETIFKKGFKKGEQ